jgi:Tol biopolymer transport system component
MAPLLLPRRRPGRHHGSDRRGDNLLQIFVGELQFDDHARPTGLAREFQLTDDEHVNWCPFWHPDGRHLVFATSRMGHENYEVFLIDADAGTRGKGTRPTRYGTELRRVTHAEGADVLPAFSSDGKTMIWTARRDPQNSIQLWAARFVMNLDSPRGPAMPPPSTDDKPKQLTIKDPDTDAMYIYDMASHRVQRYDPKTHVAVDVTDQAELDKVLKLFKSGAGEKK